MSEPKRIPKSPSLNTDNFASLFSFNGAFLEAAQEAYQGYLSSAMKLSEELLGFASGRLHANAKIGEELLKTRSLPDVLRIQQNWLRETSEQYVQQVTKIADFATEIAQQQPAQKLVNIVTHPREAA